MPGPNPWDNDPIVSPAPALGAVTVGTPKPRDPLAVEKDQLGIAKLKQELANPGPSQTPAQAEHDVLQNEQLKRELAKSPETDPTLAQAIKNLGLDEWLRNIDTAESLVKGGWATGIRGSLGGHVPGSNRNDLLGTLQGIQGATILEKLQALREQSKNGSSGMGSLTEQEGERLANSIAALNPNMSGDQLLANLAQVRNHARSLKAIGDGADPNDPEVQRRYGLVGAAPAEEAPVNPIANNTPGDQGPSLTPSDGQTRSVIDPKKQALGAQIVGLMHKGADRNTILGFAVRSDPSLRSDPKFRAWVDSALAYRAKYPKAQFGIDPAFYTSEVPMSAQEQAGNAVAQSAPGAALMQAGNAAVAGQMGRIVGDKEGVNRAMQVAEAQHGNASLLGMAGGAALAGMGGDAALGLAGAKAALPRAVAVDAAYGAAANSDNPNGNLLGNLAKGAALGAAGGAAGRVVGKAAGAVTSGVTDPTVSYVARELPGKLTLGQAVGQSGVVGKAVKGVEDRLSGLPVVGDAINARRAEGLQKMNSKAFDKALEPIKETVAGQFGENAVQEAQDKVGQAFKKALGGKLAAVDHGFVADATNAKNRIAKLPPSVAPDVESLVDSAINDYVDPATLSIKGDDLHPLLKELEGIKSSYYSQDHPAKKRIGQAVDDMIDAVEGIFQRQHPGTIADYTAAKQAFKRVSTVENAVLAAKNTPINGQAVFTSAQLGTADKANTIKFGNRHMAAAGKTEFHDFQRNMQEVLPNKVPDSGTVGRAVLPVLAVGAGAGGGKETGYTDTGLTLGSLLALAYTKAGQRILAGAVLKRPAAARAIGSAISRGAPALGHGGAAVALEGPRD